MDDTASTITTVATGSFKLWPQKDCDLDCLGGDFPNHDESSFENKVLSSTDAAYLSLPRPASLPSPSSFKIKSKKTDDRDDALKIYRQLWDGKFRVEWMVERKVDVYKLVLRATPLFADESVEEEAQEMVHVSENLKGFSLEFMFSCRGRKSHLFPAKEGANPFFDATFKESVREDLMNRVLHHFLRVQGSALIFPSDGFTLCLAAAFHLENLYQKGGDLTLLLDMKILLCDLTINLGFGPEDIGTALVTVTEVLEALGEFSKAADLYELLGQEYHTETLVSLEKCAMAVEYAGLAFKRNQQFDKAEERYIRALHLRCKANNGKIDVTEGYMSNVLLRNMMVLYGELQQQRKVGNVCMTFMALLFLAGFKPEENGLQHFIVEFGRDCVQTLKPKYQCKKAALAALANCAARPDKSHFYQMMERCVSPTVSSTLVTGCWEEAEVAQKNLHSARELVAAQIKKDASASVILPCGLEACYKMVPIKELKNCPCRTKSYCSKSCQVADWPMHKQVCPWQAKRKSKK